MNRYGLAGMGQQAAGFGFAIQGMGASHLAQIQAAQRQQAALLGGLLGNYRIPYKPTIEEKIEQIEDMVIDFDIKRSKK